MNKVLTSASPPTIAGSTLVLLALIVSAHLCPSTGYMQTPIEPGPETIRFEQKLGAQLPLDTVFVDETGERRPLARFFGDRPVVISFGYYECPNLCSIVLNATSDALAALAFRPGEDYEYVFVSIDPSETPTLAANSKRAYSRHYGKPGTSEGWHFLTGRETDIRALATAAGFDYRYDAAVGQYAHPSGILVATTDGRVSKYLYGIEYDPRDLRLALVEASDGEVGSPVDQLLLLCFHYNPLTGKYSLAIHRTLQAAGALTALVLFTFVGRSIFRERLRKKRAT